MDAMEKGFSLDPLRKDVSVLWTIWLPHMREVRQLPRFKEFVREIGLVAYWRKYGWPDVCHPEGHEDFECD
ncbi:MAG: hypothetical protein JW927_12475 [Deltaproteobacteria bacterium]|nr:hypothetical protein [Deltaproteobacteria bacterium]